MVELANTTLLPFGAVRRRFVVRVWVIAIGFILAAQRQCFLHVSQLCEYCLGASLAETNQSAGCTFPYETRGMLDICDGILEVFPWPAMLPVCHHHPPPLWLFNHHGFVLTVDRYGDDSVHGGPLTS